MSRRGRDKRNWQKLVALHSEGAGVAVVPAAGADLPSDTATGVEAGVPQDLMPDHAHHALGVELEDKAMHLQVMILIRKIPSSFLCYLSISSWEF